MLQERDVLENLIVTGERSFKTLIGTEHLIVPGERSFKTPVVPERTFLKHLIFTGERSFRTPNCYRREKF